MPRCVVPTFCSVLLFPVVLWAGLPQVEPAAVGFDVERLDAIEPLIATALTDGKMPGCVLCFGRQGHVAWLKAYGRRQVQPTAEPMTTDTLFDLASLTKPVATATSIMLLLEQGELSLEGKVADVIAEFGNRGKEEITFRDLLTHQSGLIADNPIRDYQQGLDQAFQNIYELPLKFPVREKFVYSDVNFIVLGETIRRVSGKSVHEFSRDHIFRPLAMKETGFLPEESLRKRAAPTQQRDGRWMRGEVHDPRAFLLGGVAGHAGLFSTAEDVAVYAQMLLNQGTYGEARILQPETVDQMTRRYRVPSGWRGLGWDKATGYSTNRGTTMTDAAFGHGGFTGTVLWIDPELDLFFIFLSNRVHPDGKGLVNPLAGEIATIVAGAIE